MSEAFRVVFSPEAEEQIVELRRRIASEASEATAGRFVDGLVDYCSGFATFPMRGSARDDIRPGLRVVGYRRRVSIIFSIGGEAVEILAIFYGGRDYEQSLRP